MPAKGGLDLLAPIYESAKERGTPRRVPEDGGRDPQESPPYRLAQIANPPGFLGEKHNL